MPVVVAAALKVSRKARIEFDDVGRAAFEHGGFREVDGRDREFRDDGAYGLAGSRGADAPYAVRFLREGEVE